MAYQVLARKWRPKTLNQVQGQSHVTQALSNALKRGWLHHAYLFCGTRGVGKTSLARIFAKCLNCETGVTDSPCGECTTCKEIDSGRFVDLIEVDAASRTRVEDTRDLLENVAYNPTQGRYKIYLIDEVHMLSGHSFNALLKTLEEPPAHVKFLFATTEPERIPITVLSRVLRFDLRPLSFETIHQQLERILSDEGISHSARALHYIAEHAKGSMRDALSLLEQVVAFCDGQLQAEHVAGLLGVQFKERLPELLQALLNNDFAACMQWIDEVATAGVDFCAVLDSLIASWHVLSIQHQLPETAKQHARLFGVPESVCSIAPQCDLQELQLLYQVGILGKKDMQWAPDPKMALQMTLLRMIDFRAQTGTIELSLSELANAKAVPAKQSIQQAMQSVTPATSEPLINQSALASMAAIEPEMSQTAIDTVKHDKTTTPSVDINNKQKSLDNIRQRWAVLVDSLNLVGFTGMLAKHCTIKDWQNTQLILALHPQQQAYLSPDRQKALEDAINQKTGKRFRIRIDLEALDNVTTPSQLDQQKREQAQAQLREKVESDEMVQSLANAFDAQIGEVHVVEGEEHD